MSKSTPTTMLSGAVVVPFHGVTRPSGGRDLEGTYVWSETVPVLETDRPSTDRLVTLRTTRLLAADLYVVAVVDGTGKLAEPRSLTVTADQAKARTAANRLVQKWSAA